MPRDPKEPDQACTENKIHSLISHICRYYSLYYIIFIIFNYSITLPLFTMHKSLSNTKKSYLHLIIHGIWCVTSYKKILFSPLGKVAGRAIYFTDVFSLFFFSGHPRSHAGSEANGPIFTKISGLVDN